MGTQAKNNNITILKSLILLAIIAFSSLAAFAMNPMVNQKDGARVAGDSITQFNAEIEIDFKYNVFRHEVKTSLENNSFQIQIEPKSLEQGEYRNYLLKITNSSNNTQQFEVSQTIIGYVQDLFSSEAISQSGGVLEKINVNPNSSQDIYVKFRARENINFPFTIQFNLRLI